MSYPQSCSSAPHMVRTHHVTVSAWWHPVHPSDFHFPATSVSTSFLFYLLPWLAPAWCPFVLTAVSLCSNRLMLFRCQPSPPRLCRCRQSTVPAGSNFLFLPPPSYSPHLLCLNMTFISRFFCCCCKPGPLRVMLSSPSISSSPLPLHGWTTSQHCIFLFPQTDIYILLLSDFVRRLNGSHG